MRELNHEGKVKVIYVPTAENHADMLTKALPTDVFHKHRGTIFNLAACPHDHAHIGVARARSLAASSGTGVCSAMSWDHLWAHQA